MASTTAPTRTGAAAVALAPVTILIAFLVHPFIARLPNAEAIGGLVEAGPTRWALAHVLTAVGSALIAVAFVTVRAYLHDAGEDRFSAIGLPFVVFGSVIYAFLPGLEFAPLAAVETGGDPVAIQAALEPWLLPSLLTAAITFGIGAIAFARAILVSGALSHGTARLVAVALVLMAVSRVVPLGVAQFYVQALAGLVALWPLAAVLWRGSTATPTTTARTSPAM